MISNRCARKYLVTNCNSIISKNYLRFLVDSNDIVIQIQYYHFSFKNQNILHKIYTILCNTELLLNKIRK